MDARKVAVVALVLGALGTVGIVACDDSSNAVKEPVTCLMTVWSSKMAA